MSNKASIACACAFIAAVTLASTGPALFVLPGSGRRQSRNHSRARRRRQAGEQKTPTRSTMKCNRP